MRLLYLIVSCKGLSSVASAFSPATTSYSSPCLTTRLSASSGVADELRRWAVVSAVAVSIAVAPACADEYGVEKDAPTLFTGETVEV